MFVFYIMLCCFYLFIFSRSSLRLKVNNILQKLNKNKNKVYQAKLSGNYYFIFHLFIYLHFLLFDSKYNQITALLLNQNYQYLAKLSGSTSLRYGLIFSKPPKSFSASSSLTRGRTTHFSPCFQFTGVATPLL